MAASTTRQEIQQALSWKLRMISGAKGNIYPREKHLSGPLCTVLLNAYKLLHEAEDIIRYELAHIPKAGLEYLTSSKIVSVQPKKEPIT